MQNFQNTFEKRKRSFMSPFSIYMTVALNNSGLNVHGSVCLIANLQGFNDNESGALIFYLIVYLLAFLYIP